jgi:nicotinate phosphoribosyltransferase
LQGLNLSDVKIYGFRNADLIIPNEPLYRLEGSLAKVQILETTLLNLSNYPTLIASLANKLKDIFGNEIILIEDGTKFGQSAFGSMLGAKYSIIGGLDGKIFLIF